ncbi:MAG: hypothetical protein D6767_00580 [Candidatus Hydrogenedentota bacterium]|nr:MAG: hypothetical protein D6767_00580 [Candidatus Hydrogenedentota bacterium]
MKKFVIFLSIFIVFSISSKNKPRKNWINLGERINSIYDELTPIFSQDGKTLYFCREGDPRNKGYSSRQDDQDIWMSEYIEYEGFWNNAYHIEASFNGFHYDFPVGISADGKTLYIGNYFLPNGRVRSGGISRVRMFPPVYEQPEGIKIRNMQNRDNYVNYYMAPDEKTLMVNAKLDKTLGGMDLYVSFLQENDEFSEPLHLGKDINSKYEEVTPFITSDLKTIYFSSNRPGGYGGFDVYMSRRLDDTWQHWTKPVNLGPEINSESDEISYVIAPNGKYAVFSAETETNGRDLFKVPLPKQFQPNLARYVEGYVFDTNNKPLKAKVIAERLSDGKVVHEVKSDSATGRYLLTLASGEVYGLRASKDGYVPVSAQVDLRDNSKIRLRKNLILAPLKKGQAIKLNNIFFEYNSAKLKEESYPELNRLVRLLLSKPHMKIRLEGHTDNIGSFSFNKKLSLKRAQAVKAYLVEKGVLASRISVIGYGESKPVASNRTAEGRKQNRRVEFRILNM